MSEYVYAKDLKIGDLIIASVYGNRLEAGIFVGHGRNTTQYYSLRRLVGTYERYKQLPSVDYVKREINRICSISPEILTDGEAIDYEKAMQILKSENLLK